jgi:hypothetical protein
MGRRDIRRVAEEHISHGFSRQHVFDLLISELPGERPERIAKVVRFIPSLAARSHYREPQQALLLAIVASGVLELVRSVLDGDLDDMRMSRLVAMLFVVPFATVFLGFAVYRWRGEVYRWLAWVNALSVLLLPADLKAILSGDADPWQLASRVLSLAIAGLAFHLSVRLFPKYEVVKDPVKGVPPRIVFPPEPGMMAM